MYNAMTVDVEDWFQVSVLREIIPYQNWDDQESRIIQNITKVIKLFAEYDVKATFFVLGWIAERYPEIVLTIKKYGHEVGSHSFSHKLIYEQSRDEFLFDLDKSVRVLEDLTGDPVDLYRAPSFSINQSCLWAFEELAQRGITYDSSVFPIKHDIGGMPNMPREPFYMKFKNGNVINEFPLSTLELMGENVPISGGGYLRLLPYWFIRNGIQKNNNVGNPVVIYFHPWEFDPEQPRQKLGFTSSFRHYTNLDLTENRIRKLLTEFKFTTLGQLSQQQAFAKRWPDYATYSNGVHHANGRS